MMDPPPGAADGPSAEQPSKGEAVARVGRTLGTAARRTVNIVQIPRDLVERAIAWRRRPRGSGDDEADAHRSEAQIFGGRVTREATHQGARWSASPADLTEALCQPDPAVRVRALHALGQLSKNRAEHLVAPMLHDPHPLVRIAAAEVAIELDAMSAVFSLILGLDDGDPNVRGACHHAIGQITGRPPWHGRLDAAERHDKVVALRSWWKDERLSLLVRRSRDEPLNR